MADIIARSGGVTRRSSRISVFDDSKFSSGRLRGSNANFEFSLEGAPELIRQFNKLERVPARRAINGAARKALKPILLNAKGRAPVETGLLASGIEIKSVPAKVRMISGAKVVFKNREHFGDRIKSGLFQDVRNFYPNLMELGWKDRGGNERTGFAFMRSAFDDYERLAFRIFKTEVQKRINKALTGGSKK